MYALAVQLNVSTDDGGVGGHLRFPEAEVEKRDAFASRLVFVCAEEPTERGLHAEHRQQLRRRLAGRDALRLAGVARQVRAVARVVGRDVGCRTQRVAQVPHFGLGNRVLRDALSRKPAPDLHELLRAVEGERTQQHRVDHAEDDGVGADAERQREHGDGGEAGRLGQHANGVSKVLKD